MSTELRPEAENRMLTTSTLIKYKDQYFQVRMLNDGTFTIGGDPSTLSSFKVNTGIDLDPEIAYLIGDPYFYFYRGKINDLKGFEESKPGIYYDEENATYMIQYPETEEEKEEYRYANKITTYDADEIRKAVLNHEVVIFNVPDASHSAIPPESVDDDMLKKIIKRAIKNKGIDLDQYKTRFASKNMLFNTKQVLRGDNRLSILLFDRCADALNLKYTIIVEEAGGEIIGHSLKDPIVISSQDVFNASMNNEEE